jgi:hypothetical protein
MKTSVPSNDSGTTSSKDSQSRIVWTLPGLGHGDPETNRDPPQELDDWVESFLKTIIDREIEAFSHTDEDELEEAAHAAFARNALSASRVGRRTCKPSETM